MKGGIQTSLCIFLCLASVGLGYDEGRIPGPKGRCNVEASLGEVLEILSTPVDAKPGQPLEVTLRLRSQFKPEGSWSLLEGVNGIFNRYPVPEQDDGGIRSSAKKESKLVKKTDTYMFTLNVDTYDPNIAISLVVRFWLPCNSITLSAELNEWKSLVGVNLPTVTHVPESIVDLRFKNKSSTLVGLKMDPSVLRIQRPSWGLSQRIQDGQLLQLGGYRESSVTLDLRPVPGKKVARYNSGSFEGEIVFEKDPKKVDENEGYLMYVSMNINNTPVDHMSIELTLSLQIKILLQDIQKPAIGLYNFQYNSHMSYSSQYNNSHGVMVLHVIRDSGQKLPAVFECYAVAGKNRPSIASAKVNKVHGGLEILDGLYSSASQGVSAYQAYVVSYNTEMTDYICSAESGGEVSNLFFKVAVSDNVKVTTTNPDEVVLDSDTFKKGYRFTCHAEGSPKPTISFLKQRYDNTFIDTFGPDIPSEHNVELQASDRISFESRKEGERTLVISPGGNPFDSYKGNVQFRLKCLGANQFTSDETHVDFVISPSMLT